MTSAELPYDLEAERATLGSVLLNRDAMVPIATTIAADMFYLASHQQIYTAMLSCYRRRIPPDTRTVLAALRQAGSAVDLAALSDLVADVPTSYHVEFYAAIVRQHAIKRRLIQAGSAIARLGYDPAVAADDAIGQAGGLLLKVAPASGSAGFQSVADVLTELADAPASDDGFLFGVSDLDRIIGSLHPGNLCLIAGASGSGKTTLATQAAWECAKTVGAAAIVSLEMSRRELIERLVAYETGISTQIQRTDLDGVNLSAVTQAKVTIAGHPLYIEDTPGLTAQDVRARALALAHRVGQLNVLVVDYLGLLSMGDTRTARSTAMDAAAMTMKNLGKELGCPVLLCAQLNRDVFHRESKVPTMADIREAGEAPADQIVVPMRPKIFDPTDESPDAKLFIVKHRHGQTGVCDVYFDGPRYRFRSIARYRGADGYGD